MAVTEAHLTRGTAWPFQPYPPPQGDLIHPGRAALILQAPGQVLLKSATDQWKHCGNDIGTWQTAKAVWRFKGEHDSCGRRINPPHQRRPYPILKPCEYVFSHGRGTLRRGDYPGLSGRFGVQGNHKGRYKREAGRSELEWHWKMLGCCLRRWQKGPRTKERGQPLEAEKGKERDLPLQPPEGTQTPWFQLSGFSPFSLLTSRTVR